MQINLERSRQYLKQFQLQSLFVEELGWDNYSAPPLSLLIDGKAYTLSAVAEKRGQVVYTCLAEDGVIPASNIRTKIHKETSRYALENILVYVDQAQTEQVWQWVKRDPGKPNANRFHPFHKSQSGTALLQKLEALAVSFDEEERLTLVDVTTRTRRALDVESAAARKFYERFKKEHGVFLKLIAGIHSQFDKEWYCSLMLNRLMFVYFVQKKGFLDGNTKYLRDRLQACQKLQGQDNFYSFYRYFLLQLFHSGLGSPQRTPELEQLLGKVPYLNGGLFEVHQLEQTYPDIQIPDQAFEGIFDFFEAFHWHLNELPLQNDREINPDVLGYIFEKYINQKQMGAYYTKEDITEYISKNTILPFLLNAVAKACATAFQPDSTLWRLLKDDPNRYIYLDVQKGVDLALPEAIAVGLVNVTQRQGWNRPANDKYALPTETWREHITRRQWCLELRQKIADGKLHSVNDLITYNLDIRQFAHDVIEKSEGSELLRAFYAAICQVSILDPTCGSGAFLFAALNILEPLYDACLERMQVFLDDLKRSDHPHSPDKFNDFRQILDRVAQHPNHRYFILKSIILNNLYGVDIMEEATEICKLRLFLKLVSQVERDPYAKNYGLEPLPDIDFNIRAGNTLVGFATYEEVRKAVEGDQQKKLDLFSDMERIDQSANEADQSFQVFRQIQTEHSMDAKRFREAKSQLRQRLQELNQELNRYLSESYEVGLSKKKVNLEKWLVNYQPFHWFVEFYQIMKQGGFNVIIGNPPYVEWSKIKNYKLNSTAYKTKECGNIYTTICERSYNLLGHKGYFGMIVPLSCIATARMKSFRSVWKDEKFLTHISNYSGDAHPSVLFEGVKFRLAILLQSAASNYRNYSTHFQRWLPEGRNYLFNSTTYTEISNDFVRLDLLPKLTFQHHSNVLGKVLKKKYNVNSSIQEDYPFNVYSHRIVAHFIKAFDFIPFFRNERDGEKKSEDYKVYSVESKLLQHTLASLLNSNLFYSWFVTYSDVYHCGRELILDFPVDLSDLAKTYGTELSRINSRLMDSFRANSVRRSIPYKSTGLVEYDEFYPRLSKLIVDEIDVVLAKYYGFTDEELDFIINYDIKYRMGRDTDDDE